MMLPEQKRLIKTCVIFVGKKQTPNQRRVNGVKYPGGKEEYSNQFKNYRNINNLE